MQNSNKIESYFYNVYVETLSRSSRSLDITEVCRSQVYI